MAAEQKTGIQNTKSASTIWPEIRSSGQSRSNAKRLLILKGS